MESAGGGLPPKQDSATMLTAIPLGAHSPKLDDLRALRSKAGRREQGRFAVEGPTMLAEALRSGLVPEAIYATQRGGAGSAGGATRRPVYIVPERAFAQALRRRDAPRAHRRLPARDCEPVEGCSGSGKPLRCSAGIADPGNAGTLLRSAEIFGLGGAIFAGPSRRAAQSESRARFDGRDFPAARSQSPSGRALYARHARPATESSRPAPTGSPARRSASRNASILAIGNERSGVGEGLDGWHDTRRHTAERRRAKASTQRLPEASFFTLSRATEPAPKP